MSETIKKILALGMVVMIIVTFAACQKDNNNNSSITLEDIKNVLRNADYEIVEDYAGTDDPESLLSNAVGGFSFFYETFTFGSRFVVEFKDNATADAYFEYINATEFWYAVANDKFVAVSAKHDGIVDSDEKNFLEKLVNGKPLIDIFF
ncbi:MAG: hypothetical protein FWG34_09165 [Oscillospiraceae bacterium]|nr:hypothetical protein [Oscillospiraceae bacterium]